MVIETPWAISVGSGPASITQPATLRTGVTRIALLKEEKMIGASIPTELVKMVFAQHSKSITSAFHTGADNFLMEISKTKGLNRNELAEMRGALILIINKAVDKSIEESKKSISNIVQEFSVKKEVGEKEA